MPVAQAGKRVSSAAWSAPTRRHSFAVRIAQARAVRFRTLMEFAPRRKMVGDLVGVAPSAKSILRGVIDGGREDGTIVGQHEGLRQTATSR